MSTIKMTHAVTGHTADVHPAEVDNYKLGGYVADEKAEPEIVKPKKRGRKAKGNV